MELGIPLDQEKPSPEDQALQDEMDRRLVAFRARLGPHQQRAFAQLATRIQLGTPPGYFLHPLAFPVLQLPCWCAALAARRGISISDDTVMDLMESSGIGYLHVRVQDDWIDEKQGDPDEAMMLAEALFVRHQRLLARWIPYQSPFWDRFESCWLSYGEAMLLEASLHRSQTGYDANAFESVLLRSQPLVLPASAVLAAAGLWELQASLETIVSRLVKAHQLAHDLVDAEKDLRNNNHTHVVQRYAPDGQLATLRTGLYLRGGFDAIVGEVRKNLIQASQSATHIGLDEVCSYASMRQKAAQLLQQAVFRGLFNHLLGIPSHSLDESEGD